jgi:hypothetical protein
LYALRFPGTAHKGTYVFTERVSTMKHESCSKASDQLSRDDQKDQPEHYVWSTSEKSRLRALSLYIIQSIVERHRGSIEIDLATDTINVELPEEEKVACAQAIEEQVGTMCHFKVLTVF